MDRIVVIIVCLVAVACSPEPKKEKTTATKIIQEFKRIEHSNDTSFNLWDSLLLRYTYPPVTRKLSEFDKEWYVFHDSAEHICGYVNMKGDTVIPMKYGYIPYVTDTFRHFAYVWMPTRGLVAINKNEEVLFEPYYFDTHPDETIKEGLFRIKSAGKVGYANLEGKIIIEAVYDEASSFENGYAWVGFNCYTELKQEEHNPTICRQAGIINKTGKLVYFNQNKDNVLMAFKKLAGYN